MTYELSVLLRAVHLAGENIGVIGEIPAAAVITVIGDAPIPGLIEVVYGGEHYAVFQDDLVDRAKRLSMATS